MRTNKLRRWVLRGVLLSAAAVTPLTLGGAAHAEWKWERDPLPAVVNELDDQTECPATTNSGTEEWKWE